MPSDRRQDAATATVGAAGVAGGGVVRHRAVRALEKDGQKVGRNHLVTVMRRGSTGQKKAFVGGSLLGLFGTAPLAVGATRLATDPKEPLIKSEQYVLLPPPPKKKSFLREGLEGSKTALQGRKDSLVEPVPAEVRATQLGVAAGAGLTGSAVARAAMRQGSKKFKPAVAPVAGVLAATASVPGTNKLIQQRNPNYEVTATGVRRKKSPIRRPSSKSFTDRPVPRSFREDLAKRDNSYLGSRTPYMAQRAAITAAGHPPVIGPFTGAAAAGSYAPPGQETKQAVRQYVMGSAAPVAVGAAGAYAGARAADKNEKVAERAAAGMKRVEQLENWGRKKLRMGAKPAGPGRITRTFGHTKAMKPLLKNPATIAGGSAGFLGAKMAAGAIGGQTAITLNQRDQKKYNAANGINKRDNGMAVPQTKRERGALADKKRVSAVLSATGGTLGIGGGLAFLRGRKNLALGLSTTGGFVGGANALLNSPIQRAEAKAIDPRKPVVKGFVTLKPAVAVQSRIAGAGPKVNISHPSRSPLKYKLNQTRRGVAQVRQSAALDPVGTGEVFGVLAKGLPSHVIFRGKKARVLNDMGGGKIEVLGHDDGRYITHVDRVQFPRAKKDPAAGQQLRLPFGKRDQSDGPGVMVLRTIPDPSRKPALKLPERKYDYTTGTRYSRTLTGAEKKRERKAFSLASAETKAHHQMLKDHDKAWKEQQDNRHEGFTTRLRATGERSRRDSRRNKAAYVVKRDSLEIKYRAEHPKLISAYGDKGPLPKGLDRETKMKAYEARYVHHGGDRADKYGRRAEKAEATRNVGLAAATAGGAAFLAAKTKRGARAMKHVAPKVKRTADTTAIAGATLGGAAELYGEYARGRRASYTNSPAGVAGSALRRMRDYTPD